VTPAIERIGASLRGLALLAAVTAAAPVAPARLEAQQPTPGVVRRGEGVEFDFQEVELRVVLSALAEAAGINAVVSNIPSRPITLRTSRPVAVGAVRSYLESLVQSNNLTMTETSGLVRIMGTALAPEGSGGAAQVRPGEPVQLFVHRLAHADAAGLAGTLSSLFGLAGGGDAAARPREGSLSEQLSGLRGTQPDPAAQPLPTPGDPSRPAQSVPPAGGIGVAPLGAEGSASGLTGPVQIVPDPRTNSLLIRSNNTDYATIRAAIQQIDTRPVQVLIEVLIAEIRHDKQRGLGLSTRVPEQSVGDGPTTVGGEITGGSAGDLVIRALQVGGVRADVVLRALASNSDVTILSRPLVVARNNEEARILVGSERPFVQLFRSLPTDAAVRDQVVQYRNVGTQLTIRPTINPDGYVSLSVLQEVSNATAETQFGAPVISTREARTELLVRDGRTAVIGGLVDQQREMSNSGVPFLKDIPLLGWLFRSTQQRRNTTELYLFLTPHVLRTDEQLDDATRHLQRREELNRATGGRIPVLGPRDSVPK
jgi:general secretion pathway protein D